MFLDDISDFLSTSGVTTTIRKGVMPETPDACVALYETGGIAPVHAMKATAGRVVRRPAVQVVCRATVDEYDTARTTAETIFCILDGMPTRTLNVTEYKLAAARQEPFLLNRD